MGHERFTTSRSENEDNNNNEWTFLESIGRKQGRRKDGNAEGERCSSLRNREKIAVCEFFVCLLRIMG